MMPGYSCKASAATTNSGTLEGNNTFGTSPENQGLTFKSDSYIMVNSHWLQNYHILA